MKQHYELSFTMYEYQLPFTVLHGVDTKHKMVSVGGSLCQNAGHCEKRMR